MQIESLPGAVLCWWGSVQKRSSIHVFGCGVPAWSTCLGWQRTGHVACHKPVPCDPCKYSGFIASEFNGGGKNLLVAKKYIFALDMRSAGAGAHCTCSGVVLGTGFSAAHLSMGHFPAPQGAVPPVFALTHVFECSAGAESRDQFQYWLVFVKLSMLCFVT